MSPGWSFKFASAGYLRQGAGGRRAQQHHEDDIAQGEAGEANEGSDCLQRHLPVAE